MAKYSGKPCRVNLPAALLYERMTNLDQLQGRMSELPEEIRAKMGTINFPDSETLAFTAPGVGEMKFRIIERNAPSQVKFLADTGMIPINVIIDLAAASEAETDVTATIDADIPLMVRPLIGPKLQEAADKFGEMFGQLNA
ncbi:MAG: hypothetical protein K2M09_04250 [Muribaculaceae bacterium]|nr:hypothetical protein [Muribaculaceae bacterium]